MDNPETLATLGTQDTGSRKTNQNKKQHRKRKRVATQTLPKIQVGGGAVAASYRTPTYYSCIQSNPRKVLAVIE